MAAPTGCFKCGRPGHWSRDCPSSAATASSSSPLPTQATSQQGGATAINNNKNSSISSNKSSNGSTWKPASSSSSLASSKNGKPPPALPRKRPKLTPDLLLSNDGLGYVLENFPRMVKIQGPGHELEDLKSLLDAYAHWHSRVLPYFSFDQFVEKVEKVGASKRVRVCVRELKDKVARGDEPKSTKDDSGLGMRADKDTSMDNIPSAGLEDEPLDNNDLPPDIHDGLFDEFYRLAVAESSQNQQRSTPTIEITPQAGGSAAEAVVERISEEQKLRMEANRLKALERSKARASAVLGT